MSASPSTWPAWARPLGSPWLLTPLLVLTLLVGAFAGYGDWTRSQPTRYARGGAFAAARTAPSAATAPAVARATVDPSARPATAARSTATTTAAASRARAAAAAPSSQPSTRSAPATVTASPASRRSGGSLGLRSVARGPVLPRTGTYELAVAGSEKVSFGPLSACDSTFPAQGELVVSRAAGEAGNSFDVDQRFYPDSPNRHDERHIYRYTGNDVLLTYEEATVTCEGVKQSTTVDYTPPQLRVRGPLHVGDSWRSAGGDSSRTEDASSSVTGTDTVVVGGVAWAVDVITTHVTMSGSESGTRDQRWWWCPRLGLPLRWHEDLSGSRSGATYSSSVTTTVTRLPG